MRRQGEGGSLWREQVLTLHAMPLLPRRHLFMTLTSLIGRPGHEAYADPEPRIPSRRASSGGMG